MANIFMHSRPGVRHRVVSVESHVNIEIKILNPGTFIPDPFFVFHSALPLILPVYTFFIINCQTALPANTWVLFMSYTINLYFTGYILLKINN